MNRKLLYLAAVALILVIIAFFAVRYYNREIGALSGRIAENERNRHALEGKLAISQQQTAQAEKRADTVRVTEEAKRKPLEAENRVLADENARLKRRQVERQQEHAAQVAMIPAMEDAELAEKTTAALESAYPNVKIFLTSTQSQPQSLFQADRPAVELSLRAAWEAVSSRQSIAGYQEQVGNCEIRAANNLTLADSFRAELTAERSVSGALRNELDGSEAARQAALHEIELWKAKDKARSRKGFWSRFVPKIGPGGCVALTDGRVGYGPCVAAIYPIN